MHHFITNGFSFHVIFKTFQNHTYSLFSGTMGSNVTFRSRVHMQLESCFWTRTQKRYHTLNAIFRNCHFPHKLALKFSSATLSCIPHLPLSLFSLLATRKILEVWNSFKHCMKSDFLTFVDLSKHIVLTNFEGFYREK